MDCVFCTIIAGGLPATIVCEDEDFLAFRDIAPKAETHLLVVPRAHHADLDAWVAGTEAGASDRMLAFVVRAAEAAGVTGRYRVIANVGAGAGQEVFHLHWHVMAGSDLPGFS